MFDEVGFLRSIASLPNLLTSSVKFKADSSSLKVMLAECTNLGTLSVYYHSRLTESDPAKQS